MSVQVVHRADSREFIRDAADASQARFQELDAGASCAMEHELVSLRPPAAFLQLMMSMGSARREPELERRVILVVSELLDKPDLSVEPTTPLMEVGIDSLAATEFSSRLRTLTGIALSPTLMFEHPTPRAVAAHLIVQMTGSDKAPGTVCTASSKAGTALAIRDATGQWPGGCNIVETKVQLLRACGDALGGVPATRWTLNLAVDVTALTSLQISCVRHGGFVAGAQRFDAHAFGIAPAEAGAMDPQQRRLLEQGYAALHKASARRAALMGSDDGVFLGIERPDWAIAQPPKARTSVYAVTGDNISVCAGRVSFVLGLHGPCSSVDTACASALSAVHYSAHTIKNVECTKGLSFATSLKLAPHGTLGAALAGMLSADGRCKTFDQLANGYARSEAVGALVLQKVDDEVCAHLRSSAVRQDGRSASLTAPNGSAQRMLLLAALGYANMSSSTAMFIEAHGTGTALGDPTEAGAIAAVHSARERPLEVAAGKADIGHSEAGSGQVGLLKSIQLTVHRATTGNAQLRALNPLVTSRIGQASSPLLIPMHATICDAEGGVSSFGYSGTIAHAVLSGSLGAGCKTSGRGAPLPPNPPLTFRRRRFLWHELSPPTDGARLRTYCASWTPTTLSTTGPPNRWLLLSPKSSRCAAERTLERPLHRSVVAFLTDCTTAAPLLHGVNLTLALVQRIVCQLHTSRVYTLTHGAIPMGTTAAADAAHGGTWGFARVIRLEQPSLCMNCINVSRTTHDTAMAALTLTGVPSEAEASSVAGRYLALRLRACAAVAGTSRSLTLGHGIFAITGGLGGLGLRAAGLLVECGAAGLVLTSRTGRVIRGGEGLETQLLAFAADASVIPCDAGDHLDAHTMVCAQHTLGLLHAAGVGSRGLLSDIEAYRMRWVHAAKAFGAWHLCSTVVAPLEIQVLFSSVGSGLGNVGQAAYAAGNACLDAQTLTQRAFGLIANACQWPLIGGAGMGAADARSRL